MRSGQFLNLELYGAESACPQPDLLPLGEAVLGKELAKHQFAPDKTEQVVCWVRAWGEKEATMKQTSKTQKNTLTIENDSPPTIGTYLQPCETEAREGMFKLYSEHT